MIMSTDSRAASGICVGLIFGLSLACSPALAQRTVASVVNVKGLHIEKKQDVNLQPYVLTDSAGYRWDIFSGLYVNSGTNNAYSGGMSINIGMNGSNYGFPGNNRAGLNADADELECGPYNISNVIVSRRVKVFKDAPFARWLTILENPTDQEMSVQVQLYINHCWNIDSQISSSGQKAVAPDDWALATQANGGNNNVPCTLHMYADAKCKQKPNIQVSGNSVNVRYDVKIPPRAAVIICNFEAQDKTLDDHVKTMKEFRVAKYMKDLPGSVRKLIVNMSASGLSGVDLARSDSADCVLRNNKDEDPLFGKITNESFKMKTLFGDLELKAEEVTGMSCMGDSVRVLTTNGQILSGQMADTSITLALPTGGDPLKIPLAKIKQFSFQISKQRPDAVEVKGPILILRTGDQLSFDAKALAIKFRTRHGLVDLKSEDVREIAMDNPGNALNRVSFINGSVLGGMIDDESLTINMTKPAQKLQIPRDMILQINYNQEEKRDIYQGTATLNNGDTLLGRFIDQSLTIATDVGNVTVKPNNVKAMEFVANQPGRVVVTLWDKSVHRGRLQQQELTFQMTPGPTLKLSAGQLVKLEQLLSLPPDDVVRKVDALVAKLYSESYKDRDAASEELLKMGSQVVPCLVKYTNDSDAEVRQRVNGIIEKLGGNKAADEGAGGNPPMRIMRGGIMMR